MSTLETTGTTHQERVRRSASDSPIGRFLKLLEIYPAERILIFGCGNSYLASLTSQYFEGSSVLGYDHNPDKIKTITDKKRRYPGRADYARYTCNKPQDKFDAVIAHAVLHHNPEQTTREVFGLTKQGGIVAVLDYDLQGLSEKEFLRIWGTNRGEIIELATLGNQETYRMHTSFGLEQCRTMMEQLGMTTLHAQGNILAHFRTPTKHFIYIGQKQPGQ